MLHEQSHLGELAITSELAALVEDDVLIIEQSHYFPLGWIISFHRRLSL